MADTARVIRQTVQVVSFGPSKARVIRQVVQVVSSGEDPEQPADYKSRMFLAY